MAQIQQQILTVAFTKVLDDDGSPSFVTTANIKARLNSSNVASFLYTGNAVVDVTSTSNITVTGNSFPVTRVHGTGLVATMTFPTQSDPPFLPGQVVKVSNVISSTLDGSRVVLACSTNEVIVASTAIPTYTIGNSVAISNVSGNGTVATLTHASQGSAPFLTGDQIIVNGVTPTAYNTVFQNSHIATVLTSNTTTVTFNSTATGNTNFATGVGTVTKYIPAYVSGTGTVSESYQ
jgi:hypothetical protein